MKKRLVMVLIILILIPLVYSIDVTRTFNYENPTDLPNIVYWGDEILVNYTPASPPEYWAFDESIPIGWGVKFTLLNQSHLRWFGDSSYRSYYFVAPPSSSGYYFFNNGSYWTLDMGENASWVKFPNETVQVVACVPETEICDKVDNDCDYLIDENLVRACGSGICEGTQTCSAGVWSDCSTTGNDCGTCALCDINGECTVYDDTQANDCDFNDIPPVSMCLYNPDNNPLTWDYFAGFDSKCLGIALCSQGSEVLSHNCSIDMCKADCEGDPDVEPCGTDIGECVSGERTRDCNLDCTWSEWGLCSGVGPITELCDGLDNDCDSETDEDFNVGDICSVGVGECERSGNYVCTLNKTGTECNATPGSPEVEVCNNLDDDCDAGTDENPESLCTYDDNPEDYDAYSCITGDCDCDMDLTIFADDPDFYVNASCNGCIEKPEFTYCANKWVTVEIPNEDFSKCAFRWKTLVGCQT